MKALKIALAAALALLPLGASAQKWTYNQTEEEMASRCWSMRGINPWILGVTITKEVYKDMSYYTHTEVKAADVTKKYAGGITVVTYNYPFTLEGVDLSGAEWVFYNDILVEVTVGLLSDDLPMRYTARYGEGKGYKEMNWDNFSYYAISRTWKSFDTQMTYLKSISGKKSSDTPGIGVLIGGDRTVKWYLKAEDISENGRAYNAAGGHPKTK